MQCIVYKEDRKPA